LNTELAESRHILDTLLRSYFESFLHPLNHTEYSTPTVYTIGLIFCISNKLANSLWNFVDVFIIIMCRLMSFRFKAMNSSLQYKEESKSPECMILGQLKATSKPNQSNGEWDNLLREYEVLQNTTKQLNRLISPFLMCSYIVQTYLISLQASHQEIKTFSKMLSNLFLNAFF